MKTQDLEQTRKAAREQKRLEVETLWKRYDALLAEDGDHAAEFLTVSESLGVSERQTRLFFDAKTRLASLVPEALDHVRDADELTRASKLLAEAQAEVDNFRRARLAEPEAAVTSARLKAARSKPKHAAALSILQEHRTLFCEERKALNLNGVGPTPSKPTPAPITVKTIELKPGDNLTIRNNAGRDCPARLSESPYAPKQYGAFIDFITSGASKTFSNSDKNESWYVHLWTTGMGEDDLDIK